jgi:hypothetical protein
MSISEKRVIITGGAGGPNDDSIPVYGDNKAPRGGWALDLNGKQLMWQNGKELIIVNPELLIPAENEGNRYYNFKVNGEKDYCRAWLIGDDGHGAATQPFWVEYDKMGAVDEPEPPPVDPVWIEYDYKIENGRLYLRKA